MKTKFYGILTLVMAFVVQFSFAQKTITGTVSDASGSLPGVSVLIKGSTTGVETDFDGKYSIQAKNGDVLVFSYLGYKKSERTVGNASVINVTLEEDSNVLDEIVVTSYGNTTSKAKLVSTFVQVASENINNRPNTNILNSLQGQAAGVAITSESGQPGTNKNTVVIRGVGSLSASTDPLYVIDGVPQTQAFFRNLNQNEVESVTVLKDASATAVYGNRGANGVIVITTKTAKFNESFAVGYSSSYGLTNFIGDRYNLGSSIDQLRLQRKGFDEGVTSLASAFANSGTYLRGRLTLNTADLESYDVDTNWQDVFFQQGVTQQHDVNFTLGSQKFSNFTNVGFFDQQGIVPTTGFKRFTLRSNFQGKSLNEKFTYGLNISMAFSRRNQLEQETRGGINNNVLQNPLTGYLTSSRFLPIDQYVSGAQLLADFGNPALDLIPYMLIDLFQPNSAPSFFEELKTQLNFNMNYKIFEGLSFGFRSGIDYADDRRVFAIGPEAYLSRARAAGAGQPLHGIETISSAREVMFNHVNSLFYEKTIGKHFFKLGLFTEYLRAFQRFNTQQQTGLNPLVWSPGAGTGYIVFNPATMPLSYRPGLGATKINAGLFSYFTTLDYDFDNKYGLSASFRRDGTYRFVGENRWGNFWSVGARWNIDQEEFMKSVEFVDLLKLRGSYGTTGNQNVIGRGVDQATSEIFLGSQLVRDLNSLGGGYNNTPSFGVSSFANTDLSWETTTQYSFGIDYGLFNNRITGSIDYYNRLTSDLFQTLPVSAGNGFPGNSLAGNNGAIRNSGIELQNNFDIVRNSNFKLTLTGNFAYNKDSFDDLGSIDSDGDGEFIPSVGFIRNQGGELNEYHLVRYVGVNPANGNLLFLDRNDNLTENPTNDDRVSTGKSLFPTYVGGFGLNVDYKGFFMNSLWSYALDLYKFDNNYDFAMDVRNSSDFPVSNDLFNAWTPNNRVTDVPALAATNIDAGSNLSDRFLRDASFLRLRNITIGYNVPQRFLSGTFLTNITMRLSGENLVTFTKWKGLDPERTTAFEAAGFYPAPRIVTFGIDLKF